MKKCIFDPIVFWIIGIYTLAHGLIFFNKGLYWDDWLWYKLDPNLLLEAGKQIGAPWAGYIGNYIFSLPNGITLVHGIVFFSFLLASLSLNGILKNIREMDDEARLFVVIIFTVFPCNLNRVVYSVFQYAFSYGLFFFAFLLFAKYLNGRNSVLRIISLILFFISFTTNSLLVFYVLLLFYILYIEQIAITNVKLLLTKCIFYLDVLFLPLVYWGVKQTFLVPYGMYAGYNSFSIMNIIGSPILAIGSFYGSVVLATDRAVLFWPAPTLMICLIYFLYRFSQKYAGKELIYDRRFLALGIGCFFVAVFPYFAVGNFPTLDFHSTRHQLLIPLSVAMILTYGTRLLINRFEIIKEKEKIRKVMLAVLTVTFIAMNGRIYMDYEKDWYKQLAVIENVRNSPVLQEHTTFLFQDNTTDLNVFKRNYRFYEYVAFMKQAFGDERRLGLNYEKFYHGKAEVDGVHFRRKDQYLLSSYQQKSPEYIVRIKRSDVDVTDERILRFMVQEWLHPAELKRDVQRLVFITTENL
ncbi:MAG: hypothetical protein H6Q65_84 [Firmicutes bacterium]|nr:hypothetical protein [Bacillota bacterium]